jgi:hypothetical protein
MKRMPKDPDLLEEYDFSQGVQDKYSHRFREGTNLVLLDPDIAAAFPSDEAVNTALRLVMQLQKLPRARKRSISKGADPAAQ